MKDGRKLFRTALFGYRKADVFQYVEDLNLRLTDSETKISLLRADNRDKEEKIRTEQVKAEESAAQRASEMQEMTYRLERSKTEASALGTELTKARYQAEQDHIKVLEYARKIQDMELQVAALREKADKYDRQMSKISEVMVLVRSEADQILNTAKEEAHALQEKAHAESEMLLDAARDEAERTNRLVEKFKESYSAAKAVFTNSIENMKGMFESTYEIVGETVKNADAWSNLSEEEEMEPLADEESMENAEIDDSAVEPAAQVKDADVLALENLKNMYSQFIQRSNLGTEDNASSPVSSASKADTYAEAEADGDGEEEPTAEDEAGL